MLLAFIKGSFLILKNYVAVIVLGHDAMPCCVSLVNHGRRRNG